MVRAIKKVTPCSKNILTSESIVTILSSVNNIVPRRWGVMQQNRGKKMDALFESIKILRRMRDEWLLRMNNTQSGRTRERYGSYAVAILQAIRALEKQQEAELVAFNRYYQASLADGVIYEEEEDGANTETTPTDPSTLV